MQCMEQGNNVPGRNAPEGGAVLDITKRRKQTHQQGVTPSN